MLWRTAMTYAVLFGLFKRQQHVWGWVTKKTTTSVRRSSSGSSSSRSFSVLLYSQQQQQQPQRPRGFTLDDLGGGGGGGGDDNNNNQRSYKAWSNDEEHDSMPPEDYNPADFDSDFDVPGEGEGDYVNNEDVSVATSTSTTSTSSTTTRPLDPSLKNSIAPPQTSNNYSGSGSVSTTTSSSSSSSSRPTKDSSFFSSLADDAKNNNDNKKDGEDNDYYYRSYSSSTSSSNNNNKKKKKDDDDDNDDDVAEPKSPLSFSSIFAEPTHLMMMTPDDDNTKNHPKEEPLSSSRTKSQPLTTESKKEEEQGPPARNTINDKREPPTTTTTTTTSSSQLESQPKPAMPSREAFRAKYAFLEETVETTTTTTTTTSTSTNNTAFNQSHKSVVMPSPVAAALPPKPQSLPRPIPPPLSSDGGSSSSSSSHHPGGARRRMEDRMYELESTVQRLQDEIYILNNGKTFNLASYKQISQVLFGIPDQSTSKAVLEGMAASNVMAKLLLEYRQAKFQLSKLQKKKAIPFEQKVTSVTRPKPRPKNHTKQEEDGGGGDDDDDGNTTTTLPHEQLQDPLLLVDTSSFVYRAYFSMPPMHRNSDGMPVGAVLGFCNMLNRLVLNPMLRGEQPRLVLCCDASGPTYRHDLFKDYKGHRAEAPMDLIPQFPLIQQAAKAYGMIQIQSKGYEADDVIATLASCAVEEQVHVDILSGDKDLMQLVTDTTTTTTTSVSGANNVAFTGAAVEMIDPMTMTKVTHETVVEKWGVPSHQLGDVLALAGDAADNIPGVPGIGPKIAAQLLQEYGTLEHLLENADQIKQKKRRENLIQFADQARLSQELVRLESNIPWEGLEIVDPLHECGSETKVAGLRMERMNADRILKFYDEMGFVTIKQRLLERLEMQDRVNYNKELNNASAMKKKPYSGPKKVKGLPDPEEYKDVPF